MGSSCGFLDSIFVAVTSNELRLLSTTSKLLVSLSESAHFLTSIEEDEGVDVVEEENPWLTERKNGLDLEVVGVELTLLPERNAFLSRSTWLSIFTSVGPDVLANDEDDAIPPFLLLLPILPNCEQDADETSCGGATVGTVLPTI